MKIIIKDSDSKHSLYLMLPNSMIKWKWIYSLITKNSKPEERDKIINIRNHSQRIYKAIKNYIKYNGHFVLVDIKDSDGSRVKIKV